MVDLDADVVDLAVVVAVVAAVVVVKKRRTSGTYIEAVFLLPECFEYKF